MAHIACFADMLTLCVKPAVLSDTCYNSYDERMQAVQAIGALFQNLQYTYTQLMQADPGVKLYVTGYPQVAVQGDCGANVHLNNDEIQFSQQMIQYMDWTIERAATSVGARYVDI